MGYKERTFLTGSMWYKLIRIIKLARTAIHTYLFLKTSVLKKFVPVFPMLKTWNNWDMIREKNRILLHKTALQTSFW
jgi:hypothetical protein